MQTWQTGVILLQLCLFLLGKGSQGLNSVTGTYVMGTVYLLSWNFVPRSYRPSDLLNNAPLEKLPGDWRILRVAAGLHLPRHRELPCHTGKHLLLEFSSDRRQLHAWPSKPAIVCFTSPLHLTFFLVGSYQQQPPRMRLTWGTVHIWAQHQLVVENSLQFIICKCLCWMLIPASTS